MYEVVIRVPRVEAETPDQAARIGLNAVSSWWEKGAAFARAIFWQNEPSVSVVKKGDKLSTPVELDDARIL